LSNLDSDFSSSLSVEPLHRLTVGSWEDMSFEGLVGAEREVESIRDLLLSRQQIDGGSLDGNMERMVFSDDGRVGDT